MIRIVGSTGVIITGDNSAQINQKISIRERGPLTDIDLGLLGSQLQQLRSEMKTRCSTTDQDIAVAEVARAERAATAGDQAGVAAHLKSAGNWALSVARDLALSLVADVIERSMSS